MSYRLVSPILEHAALPNCGIFATGLNAIPRLDELVGSGPWTLFAPTDEAFASLSTAAMNSVLYNALPLNELVRAHTVTGIVAEADLPGRGWLQNARGDRLPIDVFGDIVLIDGARVTCADVRGDFGIAHVIDRVLLSDRAH